MAARSRPRPTRRASRRRRCGASSSSARRGARRAARRNGAFSGKVESGFPSENATNEESRRMIDTDEGFAPLLARRVRENPAGLFARYEGVPISFAALDRTAHVLALWMRRIGLEPGDTVALMLRNSPLALALLFAIAKARAVW